MDRQDGQSPLPCLLGASPTSHDAGGQDVSDRTYRLLPDGTFAYRKGDPRTRAWVREMTDTEVIFEMLGRPLIDVTGGNG